MEDGNRVGTISLWAKMRKGERVREMRGLEGEEKDEDEKRNHTRMV